MSAVSHGLVRFLNWKEKHRWKRLSLASQSRHSIAVWEGTVAGIGRAVTAARDRPLEELWLLLHAELPGNRLSLERD